MAATAQAAVRELSEQTIATMGALLEASDRELAMPSSHACAQGQASNMTNRRSIVGGSATAVFGMSLLASSAVGQQGSLKAQRLGTWTLVSHVITRSGWDSCLRPRVAGLR